MWLFRDEWEAVFSRVVWGTGIGTLCQVQQINDFILFFCFFTSQKQIDWNVHFGAGEVGGGANLIIVDSEVGLLAPQVPLHDCPALKSYEQL